MTTVTVTATEINPIGGATNAGQKEGIITDGQKIATDDVIIVGNATTIEMALLHSISYDGTTATLEAVKLVGNIMTLSGSKFDNATSLVKGIVIYKE